MGMILLLWLFSVGVGRSGVSGWGEKGSNERRVSKVLVRSVTTVERETAHPSFLSNLAR